MLPVKQCRLRVMLEGNMFILSGTPYGLGRKLTIGIEGSLGWKCQCEPPKTACVEELPVLGNKYSKSAILWETCLERGPCKDSHSTRDNDCVAKGHAPVYVVVTVIYYDTPTGYGEFLAQLALELENLVKENANRLNCGLGEISNTSDEAMEGARFLIADNQKLSLGSPSPPRLKQRIPQSPPNQDVTEVYSSRGGSLNQEQEAEEPPCDTLVHFENVRVDPSGVMFYPERAWQGYAGVEVTVDVVAECKMVDCETTCTTSTPIIKDFKTGFVIKSDNFPPNFWSDLKKHGFSGSGASVSLEELADEGFVDDGGVSEPGNAYTWFAPVTDAIDFGVGHGTMGPWGDLALGKEAVRPKGKKSIPMDDWARDPEWKYLWDYLTGGVKECTCTRHVSHSAHISKSS